MSSTIILTDAINTTQSISAANMVPSLLGAIEIIWGQGFKLKQFSIKRYKCHMFSFIKVKYLCFNFINNII